MHQWNLSPQIPLGRLQGKRSPPTKRLKLHYFLHLLLHLNFAESQLPTDHYGHPQLQMVKQTFLSRQMDLIG